MYLTTTNGNRYDIFALMCFLRNGPERLNFNLAAVDVIARVTNENKEKHKVLGHLATSHSLILSKLQASFYILHHRCARLIWS